MSERSVPMVGDSNTNNDRPVSGPLVVQPEATAVVERSAAINRAASRYGLSINGEQTRMLLEALSVREMSPSAIAQILTNLKSLSPELLAASLTIQSTYFTPYDSACRPPSIMTIAEAIEEADYPVGEGGEDPTSVDTLAVLHIIKEVYGEFGTKYCREDDHNSDPRRVRVEFHNHYFTVNRGWKQSASDDAGYEDDYSKKARGCKYEELKRYGLYY